MAASFEYFGSTATIAPPQPARPVQPAPQAQATTATAVPVRPYMQRLAESTLFNASVTLLVFAAFVYSAGATLAWFPLGTVTPDQDFGLWFGTIAGVLAASGAITGILAAAVVRVQQ